MTSLDAWIRVSSWAPVPRSRAWLGVFQGHEILVVTRGLSRARLYLDGEFRDERSPLQRLIGRVLLLSSRLTTEGSEITIVDVYLRSLWPTRIEVRVAGKPTPMNPCAHE